MTFSKLFILVLFGILPVLPASAEEWQMSSDPRAAIYEGQHSSGDLAAAEATIRDLEDDFPDDPTPKIELALLLLQKDDRASLCEAVESLEDSLSMGELFISRRALDEIYAGSWSVVATIEGSEIARDVLEFELARQPDEAIGLNPNISRIGIEEIDDLGRRPVLCERATD